MFVVKKTLYYADGCSGGYSTLILSAFPLPHFFSGCRESRKSEPFAIVINGEVSFLWAGPAPCACSHQGNCGQDKELTGIKGTSQPVDHSGVSEVFR